MERGEWPRSREPLPVGGFEEELSPEAAASEAAEQAEKDFWKSIPPVHTIVGWGWVAGAADQALHVTQLWSYPVSSVPLKIIGGDLELYVSGSAGAVEDGVGYNVRVGTPPTANDPTTAVSEAALDALIVELAGVPGSRQRKGWRLTPYGFEVPVGQQVVFQAVYRREVGALALANMMEGRCTLYVLIGGID